MKKSKSLYGLHVDKNQIDRLFADLPQVTKKATARTLDAMARKVNRELKSHVSLNYNVPKGDMTLKGGLIRIQRANVKTNKGRAVIFITEKGRTLMEYGAVQIGEGIKVAVTKSSKVIKGGWIGPLKKGGPRNQLAFAKAKGKKAGLITRRTKSGKQYKHAKREILYGPSIANLYTNEKAETVIVKTLDENFQKELDKQFNKEFEKKSRR